METKTKISQSTQDEWQRIRILISVEWKDSMIDDPPESFCSFAELLLEGIPRQRQNWANKQRMLRGLLFQLLRTGLKTQTIRDSRSTSDSRIRFRTKLWDALVKRGWAIYVPGHRRLKYQTRYYATLALLQRVSGFESIIFPEPELARKSFNPDNLLRESLVYGHTGKRELASGRRLPKELRQIPLKFPELGKSDFGILDALEHGMQDINHVNNSHQWQVTIREGVTVRPSVTLRQIHVGAWNRAFRMYTGGPLSAQALSKSSRKTIRIDGQPTVELDYSGMFPRMLYHSEQINAPNEMYPANLAFPVFTQSIHCNEESLKVLRRFVKKSINISLNTASKGQAKRSIGHWLSNHRVGKWLKPVICEVEGLTIEKYLDRLEMIHAQISHKFYTAVGLEMMTHEASIMFLTLFDITTSGRPVLGIHDGLLCKACDADFAQQAMVENYRARFPAFAPEIRRSTDD